MAAAPASEAYRFRPWHTLIIFLMAFSLDVPFLIENFAGKEYPVWKTGAIIVTGASSGIGKDAVLALAKKNYTVFAGVRKKEDMDALSTASPNITPVLLDVTTDKSVDAAYKVIVKELDTKGLPLVGLVNNAGISQNIPVEFHEMKDIENIFQVNLFGVIRLTQKFLPFLRQNGGRIINISSVLGKYTRPDVGTYCASKHALEAYSDALRRELLPLDVSVSVIQPGFTVSPIHDKIILTKKAAPEAAKTVYPHLYTSTGEEKGLRHIAKASPTKVATNAIIDALISPHPQARYAVANVDSIPSTLIMMLVGILPDRLQDLLVTAEKPFGV